MRIRDIAWSEILKDIYNSKKFRSGAFIAIATYWILIKMGMGVIFSLFLLIPASFLFALFFFSILEGVVLPFYKWLQGKK